MAILSAVLLLTTCFSIAGGRVFIVLATLCASHGLLLLSVVLHVITTTVGVSIIIDLLFNAY